MEPKLLGEEIRRLRLDRGLTQIQLGVGCGLSRASIANIERGHQNISLDKFCLLSLKLGVLPGLILEAAIKDNI